MRHISTFSGVEGFGVGFDRAGMQTIAMVEKAKHPRTILARHFPTIPLLDDINTVTASDLPAGADIISGGFPCKNLSKGNVIRKGLAGDDSGLFFEFVRLIDDYQPDWFVLENVDALLTFGLKPAPGIIDPDPGNKKHWVPDLGADFETLLRALADLGRYHVGWRLVDALHLGVPQRRKRLLIVGHHRDRERLVSVLRDSDAGREDPRADNTRSGGDQGRPPTGASAADRLGRVMFRKSRRPRGTWDYETWVPDDYSNTLNGFDGGLPGRATQMIVESDRVRSLTPVEWERLDGFDDDWTAGIPEAARWTALGNALPVPISYWLGRRIMMSTPTLTAA